jgi:hypothetical protein
MVTIFKTTSNVVSVFDLLIKRLQIPVSSFTIKNEVQNHPDYPSMLALSDCLTSWKVPNEAYQLDKEKYEIEELPFPFVAHLKILGGQFTLITNVKEGIVEFSNEKQRRGKIGKEEFLKQWDGVILYAEKAEGSGEEYYSQSLIKGWVNNLRLPFLLLIILSLIFYAVDYTESPGYYVLLGLKLAGIVVSGLLLVHSINASNPFIQNLCGLGKKNDCNAILKSDAARVTSWLTWSEVGMFYFAGSFLCLLIIPSSIVFISLLNLLCLPYTFYSIGYQIKIKTWCVLCCSVQALLWLEAFTHLLNGYDLQSLAVSFSFTQMLSYLLCFLLPAATWSFIKPFLLKASQLEPLNQQLKRFKYSAVLFNQALKNQPRYAMHQDVKPLVFGNSNAQNIITMVSNPMCNPCGAAHNTIDRWLEYRDDLQLNIVFMTGNHDDDIRTKVARRICALNLQGDGVTVEKAMKDWYKAKSGDLEAWGGKYPVEIGDDINEIIARHKNWCDLVDITFTPTIFVNGHKLPQPYLLDDIQHLLE